MYLRHFFRQTGKERAGFSGRTTRSERGRADGSGLSGI